MGGNENEWMNEWWMSGTEKVVVAGWQDGRKVDVGREIDGGMMEREGGSGRWMEGRLGGNR